MKKYKYISFLVILAMLFIAVTPAFAQLGATDVSSFTIQNVSAADASVTVVFYDANGVAIQPDCLDSKNPCGQPNPFTLAPGASYQVYVPNVPGLLSGSYSVVIQSDQKVVAIANLLGQGSVNFNGSYSGFSDADAAPTFYLPGVVFNYYGWYSLISAQNVGSSAADITLTIKCLSGETGTLTATAVPSLSSANFVLKQTTPTGFLSTTKCNGSAVISSVNNLVVTDNQTVPANGNMQSYSGVSSGSPEVFVPALYNSYFGWNASVNIQKLGAGSTTVTIAYSDGSTPSTCNLTDAVPACLLYMPTVHPAKGYFGATITASMPLMVIANAANGSQAQTYNGVADGSASSAVGIPSVMKAYYNWNTSFTCQNVGAVATTLNISYSGFAGNAYDTPSLNPGETIEIYTPGETFLPAGYQGGATVTANAGDTANVACIVNFNNPYQMAHTLGDWSMSYNAFSK